jgi:hypothetical protein
MSDETLAVDAKDMTEEGQKLADAVKVPQDAVGPAPLPITKDEDGVKVVADAAGEPVIGATGDTIPVTDSGIPTMKTQHGDVVVADPSSGEAVLGSTGDYVPAAEANTALEPASGVEIVTHPDDPTEPVLDNTGSVIPVAVEGAPQADPVANDAGTPASDKPGDSADPEKAGEVSVDPTLPAELPTPSEQNSGAPTGPEQTGDAPAETPEADAPVAEAPAETPGAEAPEATAPQTDTPAEPPKLNGLVPECLSLADHVGEEVIKDLKEAGNLGLQAIAKYGPEEMDKMEAELKARFLSVHNKLAGLLAALEGVFSRH